MLRLICCQAHLWILMTYERPDVGSGEWYFAAQSVVPVRTATNHSPRRSVTLAGPRHELQERRQDPFRHPPDHLTTHDVGGQGPLRAPHRHRHLPPPPGRATCLDHGSPARTARRMSRISAPCSPSTRARATAARRASGATAGTPQWPRRARRTAARVIKGWYAALRGRWSWGEL